MPLERGSYNQFENYDESEVQSLTEQGWQMDADGLDEETAQNIIRNMTVDYRAFKKEDGTCTILVKQQSAYESLSGGSMNDIREMRSGFKESVNEVMEGNDPNGATGTNGRP